MVSKQQVMRMELENRQTTEAKLIVPAALGKWKKGLGDLDIPVCNQDHKAGTVVKFPLANE